MLTVSQNDLLIITTVKTATVNKFPIQNIFRRPYLSPNDGSHNRVKHQPKKKLEPKKPTCQPGRQINPSFSTQLYKVVGLGVITYSIEESPQKSASLHENVEV